MAVLGRFTEAAQAVIVLAQEIAKRYRQEAVTDLHLLAAVTESRGIGRDVLNTLGVGYRDVETALGGPPTGPRPEDFKMVFSPLSKKCLEAALEAAKSLDQKYIGTEHLLLGILVTEGPAGAWLEARGVTRDGVHEAIRTRLGTPRKEETDANRQHVVSVRLDDDALQKIDALIQADLFKSRSEAAYFLIRKGLEAQATIVDLVGERLGEIKRIQEELKRLFDEHTGS